MSNTPISSMIRTTSPLSTLTGTYHCHSCGLTLVVVRECHRMIFLDGNQLCFQLTWLTDPVLVTLVYPNRMQYAPHVLQEASLLDGVDASVCGNGRRFSKTSSYPPCRCYAFHLIYLYFLTTSLSPLFLLIHSFS